MAPSSAESEGAGDQGQAGLLLQEQAMGLAGLLLLHSLGQREPLTGSDVPQCPPGAETNCPGCPRGHTNFLWQRMAAHHLAQVTHNFFFKKGKK